MRIVHLIVTMEIDDDGSIPDKTICDIVSDDLDRMYIQGESEEGLPVSTVRTDLFYRRSV